MPIHRIDPSLIEAIAAQLQRMPTSRARATEIAAELETLLGGLDNVLPTVDFLDEPDAFRAALWALRDPAVEAHRDD